MSKKKFIIIVIICIVLVAALLLISSFNKNKVLEEYQRNEHFIFETCEKVSDNLADYLKSGETALITESIGLLHEAYLVSLSDSKLAIDRGAKLLWLAEEMYPLEFSEENYKVIICLMKGIVESEQISEKYWIQLNYILQKARSGEDFSMLDIEV